jgi:hypothetical protein
VVECLDRVSARPWIEHQPGSLMLVIELDAEFILEISPIPEQVDDDSVGLPMSKVVGRG